MSKASDYAKARERPTLILPDGARVQVSESGHVYMRDAVNKDEFCINAADVPALIEWLKETYE